MKNNNRYKLFIGSSSESTPIAEKVHSLLRNDYEIYTWDENVFSPGGNTYNSLLEKLNLCDFGIFILSADDKARSRAVSYFAPRDNIIFETGVAFGVLSPERTFLIPEKIGKLKIPTDLLGFTICKGYERASVDADIAEAVGQLKVQMHHLGRRRGSLKGETKIGLIARTNELLRAASRTITMVGRDLTWIDDYKAQLKLAKKRNVAVTIYGQCPNGVDWKNRIDKIKSMNIDVRCTSNDLGLRFTIVDEGDINLSEFIICSKEKQGDDMAYRFEHHACKESPVLWNTLDRLVGIYPKISKAV